MTRKALVRAVNPHLICVLCSGYIIEASTVIECLHSFCRSCLIKYLENSKFCPICDVQLNRYNPMLSVRCDPTLQQLVYKLVPGLYTNEMARRRKYYSQLGGPSSSDNENAEFPAGDAYFSPQDPISLSLEFTPQTSKEEEKAVSEEVVLEKQAGPHRRYLQCPAAVTMSHIKKFLRMKYTLSQEFRVDIIYDGEVLSDDFSLIDVAYTFSWNKASPMRFKFRIIQKVFTSNEATNNEIEVPKDDDQEVNSSVPPSPIAKTKTPVKQKEDVPKSKAKFHSHKANLAPEVPPLKVDLKDKEGKLIEKANKQVEKSNEVAEKIEKPRVPNGKRTLPLPEPIVIDDVDDEDDVFEVSNSRARSESPSPDPEPKKQKLEPPVKAKEPEKAPEPFKIVLDDKAYRMETQEDEEDEERLRISASEEDNTLDEKPVEQPDRPLERVSSKSEERRREKKKNKKNKHHHHHRHHDRKKDSPPASATILPTPENDVMKLKVKLTAIKSNCNTKVTGYSVVEDHDEKKESKENGLPPKSPKSTKESEKPAKENYYVDEKSKEKEKCPADVINNNKPDYVKKFDAISKEKLFQMRQVRHNKHSPKQNGGLASDSLKLPPSSITVSKITAAEKRQIEEQKLLTRNNNNGLDSKRPSLEIMLVNAPKKQPSTAISMDETPKPIEVKKVMRPTPPSIPLSKINSKALCGSGFTFPSKGSTPAKPTLPQLMTAAKVGSGDSGALDLSEKSSRKSPESPASRSPPLSRQHAESSAMRNLMTLTETAVHVRSMMAAQQESTQLKIPTPSLTMNNKVGYQARPCKPGPNQTVRQIPNPSALAYRQQHLNGRSLGMPSPVIPALRKMESMTKNIEKVAAGLSVKAIEAYGK